METCNSNFDNDTEKQQNMETSNSKFDNDIVSCKKCENTLMSFLLLCENSEDLFQFLYKHKVLIETKYCSICNKRMSCWGKSHIFRCLTRTWVSKYKKKRKLVRCHPSVSQLKGTFFERHKMTINKICKFVAYWALFPHPRQHFLVQELGISPGTCIYYSNSLREVCYKFICKNSQPLGGVGKTVEIDEAKIGNKDNKGQIDGEWIFGGIERESKKTFIIPVSDRGQETLLPIIKEYVLPGTTIVSDCWKAYDCLQSEGFQHLKVNHSINFVNPESGANTQMIEKLWTEVRSGVPRYGNRKHHLHSFIAEFLFKRQFNDYKERLHYLWVAISNVYDPTQINLLNDNKLTDVK